MLCINNNLYVRDNILNFIDTSVNYLISSVQGLKETKEYWLFYFVKNDFYANMTTLYNANIDFDFLGFPVIRMNTRHAIEAFLDLYNLCNDKDYIEVLKYGAHQPNDVKKYFSYIYNQQFTIESKYKIAKFVNGKDYESLLRVSKKCSDYIHPNVYVEVIPQIDKVKKEKILKELLNTNLSLLDEAYNLLLWKFNNGCQPQFICCPNGNCKLHYQQLLSKYRSIINTQLFVEIVQQQPNLFQ